ncbi:hypothetical protein HKD24_00125 [Gluconobacter sp. LMG 31484]|uniref:Uncharacterized protein n=1 Tax=Gluconobacter vitians TaxID=2728102 RepID=A0ABR9Y1Z8_9PROT|nr:hypothetical protein [Gluconobacter vitians]MBF0857623.1 hypothetical protein [Gluconobacter vitians]
MTNEVGILSITRTSPHEYDFEIALSDTTEDTRIHNLVLTATVQNQSGSEIDFHHEEARVLSVAQDCITVLLKQNKDRQEAHKQRIIAQYELTN